MYTHKFKVFANIVYPVQIITSEVFIRWFCQKNKKKNKKKKTNKRTRKNKIIHSTPIVVFTNYFGHISYYLCIFTLLSFNIYMISIEIH